jgi:DNA-binding CsgD family transcriptional regulator
LERERELAIIAESVARARRGDGVGALVIGPAGIGKSRLLQAAVTVAKKRGFEVLQARGAELEQAFAFGVVRQLFEPWMTAARESGRTQALRGAAAGAAPLLDPGPSAGVSATAARRRSFELLHSLYWLCANIAGRGGLALVIDDLQWADESSLQFIGHLLTRIQGLRLLLMSALRAEDCTGDELVVRIASNPAWEEVVPAPLSDAACGELVARRLGESPAPPFARACHEATGGNPLLMDELARAIQADGIAPSQENTARVLEVAPGVLASAILERVARLGKNAPALARAVSVLGEGAKLRVAATLAGLQPDVAAPVTDRLIGAEILLPRRPLEFVHPIVREAIYRDLGPAMRAAWHARAARLLEADGEPAERVAAHLLLAEPTGDRSAALVLRAAAQQALARGAPGGAVGYLRRALVEPIRDPRLRTDVLRDLARAEWAAQDPRAADRLGEALAACRTARERLVAACELGVALHYLDRQREAAAVIQRALAESTDAEPEAMMKAQALLLSAVAGNAPAGMREQILQTYQGREPPVDTPAGRLLMAMLAFARLNAGWPAARCLELARCALHGGGLLADEGGGGLGFLTSVNVLSHCGALRDAQRLFDAGLVDARARFDLPGQVAVLTFRSNNSHRLGRLADAEHDAHQAFELGGRQGAPVMSRYVVPFLVQALVDQGSLDAAERVLTDAGAGQGFPPGAHPILLDRRASLRVSQGRFEEALSDLLACGDEIEAWGLVNPHFSAWRSAAASLFARNGEHERAEQLVSEELEHARRFGAPGPIAVALRRLGGLQQGEAGIALIREALSKLTGSGMELERAHAALDLGRALRHAGKLLDAREPLREALELAHHAGAGPLGDQAHRELLATGARPRRPVRSGIDALTPSERQVCELAAQEMTSRQIAQTLFITTNTAATHLKHAYRKLGVANRRELMETMLGPPATR